MNVALSVFAHLQNPCLIFQKKENVIGQSTAVQGESNSCVRMIGMWVDPIFTEKSKHQLGDAMVASSIFVEDMKILKAVFC